MDVVLTKSQLYWYLGMSWTKTNTGPLFTKRMDVLPQDLVKSRSHEIRCYNDRIALTGISEALLPRCLSNFRAIWQVKTWISGLRVFARSCGKTPVRLMNRGPEVWLEPIAKRSSIYDSTHCSRMTKIEHRPGPVLLSNIYFKFLT